MAENRFINIDFPFKDSPNGYYFKLNNNDKDAIRADLLHLLLTNKGERLYLPDFGSDLRKYIFEPNDNITHDDIRNNLNETIKKYIPNQRKNIESRFQKDISKWYEYFKKNIL